MDRNQAKKFYPILEAFAEGKMIECRNRTWEFNNWHRLPKRCVF